MKFSLNSSTQALIREYLLKDRRNICVRTYVRIPNDFLKNPYNEIDHLCGDKFPRSWTILLIAFSERIRAISLALELTWPLSSTRASTRSLAERFTVKRVVGVGTIDRESAPGAKLRESIPSPLGKGHPSLTS